RRRHPRRRPPRPRRIRWVGRRTGPRPGRARGRSRGGRVRLGHLADDARLRPRAGRRTPPRGHRPPPRRAGLAGNGREARGGDRLPPHRQRPGRAHHLARRTHDDARPCRVAPATFPGLLGIPDARGRRWGSRHAQCKRGGHAMNFPILAVGPQPADFSGDTLLISLIKAVVILLFLLLSVLFALWFERRIIGRLQQRLGPNVRGPFGPETEIFGVVTPLQLTDMPVAVLYILAVTAMGVYGIVLGGWSSGSTYPLLGSMRSAAQIISYELGMALSLVSVFIVSGSMSTSQIVDAQTGANGGTWWAFALLPSFLVFIVSMVGETNRLPFDLP